MLCFMMMYHEAKFGCEMITSLKDIAKSHILIIYEHYSIYCDLFLKTAHHFFSVSHTWTSLAESHILIIYENYCDLILKTANHFFFLCLSHKPVYDDVPSYLVCYKKGERFRGYVGQNRDTGMQGLQYTLPPPEFNYDRYKKYKKNDWLIMYYHKTHYGL